MAYADKLELICGEIPMSVNIDDSNHFYQKIAGITDQMLHAVKNKDWQKLSALELYCAGCIDANRAKQADKILTETELSDKVDSLKKILSDDRKIRDLLEPWMSEFTLLINGKPKSENDDSAS